MNKNAVDKNYLVEFSDNLAIFVTECIFVGYGVNERVSRFTFVKGHKI